MNYPGINPHSPQPCQRQIKCPNLNTTYCATTPVPGGTPQTYPDQPTGIAVPVNICEACPANDVDSVICPCTPVPCVYVAVTNQNVPTCPTIPAMYDVTNCCTDCCTKRN